MSETVKVRSRDTEERTIMLRASGSLSALTACAALAVACHGSPAPQATSTRPAPADQSKVFFPATVETYGLNLPQSDRDHLAELHALRQIDPCGLVDQQILAADNRRDFSYTYSAVHEIEVGGVGDPAGNRPLGGEGCVIAFPSTNAGLTFRVLPGEPRANDAEFSSDSPHAGVAKRTSPCMFRASLPLTAMAGAPKNMRDPVIEVTPTQVTTGGQILDDTSLCRLGEAMADAIAAQVRQRGIPVYSDHDSVAARFLTSDPCAAAVELHAVGISWKEPRPQAQYPTTWRHPGVCNLQLTPADSGPASSSAVVRYGLAAWFDDMVTSAYGNTPARSEQDSVTLFDITTDDGTAGCQSFVVAKTGLSVEPTKAGSGAPGLGPDTPVVTVRLRTPQGGNCADIAKQAALAAVKRAT
jgi:hypothetical protein